MKATEQLKTEHEAVKLMMKILVAACDRLDLSRILCKLKPDMPGHPLAEKNRQLI